jgi:2',3'-cyclic-nucleotide 3'-phosphodiesterase/NEDD4-binding protein 2
MSGVLFLVRGLPGSGKTSFATAIWNEYAVCEADKFFYDKEGNYNFDVSKLKEAHTWCKNQVETRMIDHQNNQQYYPEIAVSNTFTQEWEMEDYFKLAEKYGYKVVSLIIENRHGRQNVHGVPEDKLQIMKDRFQIKL